MVTRLGKIFTLLYWLAMIAVVVGGIYMLVPRYRNYRKLQERRAQLEHDNMAMQQEVAKMRRMRTRFAEDPEFVERIARGNRRIRPGEVVFIFGDEEGNRLE